MNTIKKLSRYTKSAPKDAVASQTVAFSHYNNISAQLPIDVKTGKIVGHTIKEQANQCLENLKAIIESVGHVMDDAVKLTVFLKDISDSAAVDAVYKSFFKSQFPTRTTVAVAALPLEGALVQIDALISNGEGTTPQKPLELVKISRNTAHAPINAVSSQTVAFSHYNNLSAQLPIVPQSGQLIEGGIKAQTEQCLNNIKAILESIDHILDDVVKTTVYLKNVEDIDGVNDAFVKSFPNYVPARTIVIASALPMDALIQIDTVVSHGDGTPPQLPEDTRFLVIEANHTENAPKAVYTQTVAYSHYNHISGQLPIDVKTNRLVSDDVKTQTKQCLNNIKAILEHIEHKMDDIVKVNIQLRHMSDIDEVNEIYTTFFESDLPARTTIGVAAIPMDALVQIDVVVSNAEGTPA